MTQQVSFTTSHPIPHQLFTFHAYIWLCLWNNGQVHGCCLWNFTWKTWRVTKSGTSNPSDHIGVHLLSKARICNLGLQAPHFQMVLVVDVAYDILVPDHHMDLWKYVCCRGKHLRKAQMAVLGGSKIHYTSKKKEKPLFFFLLSSSYQPFLLANMQFDSACFSLTSY